MTRLDDDLLTLLAESGLDDEPELGELLAGLRDLAAGPAPQPSPAVDALLAGSGSARRGRHSRRGVLIGVLVLASIGSGVTAAAADPDLRAGAAGAVAAVVQVVHPGVQAESRRPAVPVGRTTAPHTGAQAAEGRPVLPVLPDRPGRTAASHGPSAAAAHRVEGPPVRGGQGSGSATSPGGSGASDGSHRPAMGGPDGGGQGRHGSGGSDGSSGGSDGTGRGGGHAEGGDAGSHGTTGGADQLN